MHAGSLDRIGSKDWSGFLWFLEEDWIVFVVEKRDHSELISRRAARIRALGSNCCCSLRRIQTLHLHRRKGSRASDFHQRSVREDLLLRINLLVWKTRRRASKFTMSFCREQAKDRGFLAMGLLLLGCSDRNRVLDFPMRGFSASLDFVPRPRWKKKASGYRNQN